MVTTHMEGALAPERQAPRQQGPEHNGEREAIHLQAIEQRQRRSKLKIE